MHGCEPGRGGPILPALGRRAEPGGSRARGGQRPFLWESGFLLRLMSGRCSLVGKGQRSRRERAEVGDTPG